MTENTEQVRYVPLHGEAGPTAAAKRLPFDLASLRVTGLVIVCELDVPPPGNAGPTLSMKITQYLRLSDQSLIRLDMDRGGTAFRHGHAEPVSWKRSSADVFSEVLTLVQGDEPDSGSFPWDDYAQAARLREIDVDSESLRNLPYTVLISDELATIFEF